MPLVMMWVDLQSRPRIVPGGGYYYTKKRYKNKDKKFLQCRKRAINN